MVSEMCIRDSLYVDVWRQTPAPAAAARLLRSEPRERFSNKRPSTAPSGGQTVWAGRRFIAGNMANSGGSTNRRGVADRRFFCRSNPGLPPNPPDRKSNLYATGLQPVTALASLHAPSDAGAFLKALAGAACGEMYELKKRWSQPKLQRRSRERNKLQNCRSNGALPAGPG